MLVAGSALRFPGCMSGEDSVKSTMLDRRLFVRDTNGSIESFGGERNESQSNAAKSSSSSFVADRKSCCGLICSACCWFDGGGGCSSISSSRKLRWK